MLPKEKPRYVMGVGYPEDIIVSIALGADMFDCVWPTRTGRFGNAIVEKGMICLKHARFADDFEPVSDKCSCPICTPRELGGMGISRSFLHHLAAKETVGSHLLTIHNVWHHLTLVKEIRQAIVAGRFVAWLKAWFKSRYSSDDPTSSTVYPRWAVEALRRVDIDLKSDPDT